jgi:hypothetical protein
MGSSTLKSRLQGLGPTVLPMADDWSAVNEYISAMSSQLGQMARDAGDLGLATTLEAASIQARRNAVS